MRIAVHVTPRSGRDEITGWRGSRLMLRVSAPAESSKANKAVRELLASALRIPKRSVHMLRGETSRYKQLELNGVEEAEVFEAFGKPGNEEI